MTLESQVCSLELAKRIDQFRIGAKHRCSLFIWLQKYKRGGGLSDDYHLVYRKDMFKGPGPASCDMRDQIAAYTVAELGEMLPASFDWTGTNVFVEYGKSSIHGDYLINLRECARPERMTIHIRADTEADARAKMLIYLLENKLITL